MKKRIKRQIKKTYYEIKAGYSKLIKSERWFMNYGFLGGDTIELKPEDEKYRCHMQLYNRILQSVSIKDKNILEVSCGKGGGAYYYMKYHHPASIVGVDLSKNNIKFCRTFCQFKNVEFYPGNAESFDLKGRFFDVVLSLEASHNYANKLNFYKNVFKHLKPGGYFILADVMFSSKLNDVRDTIISLGFTVEKFEDMTPGPMKSMEYNSKIWYPLSNKFPALIPSFIKNYQASTDSPLYKKLKAGEGKYVSYVFKKNG